MYRKWPGNLGSWPDKPLPALFLVYVILPNTAHSQGFSKNRQLLWYVAKNFLDAPTPVAS